ncbi:MAG: winged helix-turn-helix domain-containing protein [Alphaproteobacteria bacterium]|nr:winged helix-turn-helix domain-containing protein [Alphaproteobacteria bacterium]
MLYVFDDYVLDTDRRELRRRSAAIDVEPQVFDLITYLVQNRDRVASRDDLISTIWQGRIVSESTLSSRINAARTALGDSGAAQRLIRTLPRKGVRFVGEVREGEMADEAPPPAPAAAPASMDGATIAVLPFTNMGADSESDYFADGMAEEIITALSRCGGLLVIARNSSFIYKGRAVDIRQVGRELGVGYVLEGSVRRHGQQLRVTAQLIETAAGTHLWAERYDGTLDGVFDLQDRIAESTAAAIEPKLRYAEVDRVRRKPTESLEAYDLWLRALAHFGEFTPDAVAAAQRSLAQALAIDPDYALAMASIAYYHAQCHFQGWLPTDGDERARALELAYRAARLAPNEPNVLWQVAFAIWTFEQSGPKSLELFRRSLHINPSSAAGLAMAGWVEAANGDAVAGRALLERSMRLSPRHPRGWFAFTGMAITCHLEQNYAECIAWAEKALVQHPRFAIALRMLAAALVNSGQLERAKAVMAEALSIEPDMTLSGLTSRIPLGDTPMLRNYRAALVRAGLPE